MLAASQIPTAEIIRLSGGPGFAPELAAAVHRPTTTTCARRAVRTARLSRVRCRRRLPTPPRPNPSAHRLRKPLHEPQARRRSGRVLPDIPVIDDHPWATLTSCHVLVQPYISGAAGAKQNSRARAVSENTCTCEIRCPIFPLSRSPRAGRQNIQTAFSSIRCRRRTASRFRSCWRRSACRMNRTSSSSARMTRRRRSILR